MTIIQLSDAQVAAIANRVGGRMSPARENPHCEWEAPKAGGCDCGRRAERVSNLVHTVLADLRALQVAARTANRREVENRIVAIIDGIENTIAED